MASRIAKASSFSIDFFKVYFSKFSSFQLKFPPALAPLLKGTTSNNATLKDHNGKVWDVQLEKAEEDLIVTDGWQDFATHHSLSDGDFLTFKYDRNSHFDVELYHANGFKRRKTLANESFCVQVKEEEETEIETEQTNNKPNSGCKRAYSETSPKRTQTPGSLRGRRPKLSNTTARIGGNHKLAKGTTFMDIKNPSFVTDISQYRTSQYILNIPISILRDHNVKLKKEMELRDENGMSWPVRLSFSKNGSARVTSGWIDFYKANNVTVGDKCIIEFIPMKGNATSIMQVRVVRKGLNKSSRKFSSLEKPRE